MKHTNLIRIVRLTLAPENVDNFLQMFDSVCTKIRASEGCLHLELLQDSSYPNLMTTYSIWENHEMLDKYRSSDLFQNTWNKTKKMFAAPPMAFSNIQVKSL